MIAPADQYTNSSWLDLRYFNETEADENGFIKLSLDGKSFVNGKGVLQLFWPVNGARAANEPKDAKLKSYDRYLAKIGVNLISFHAVIPPKDSSSKIDEVDTIEARNVLRAVAALKKKEYRLPTLMKATCL
ncbi:MAG: hypothetical protein ABIR15_02495 [Chitinophagaceae bacterium]